MVLFARVVCCFVLVWCCVVFILICDVVLGVCVMVWIRLVVFVEVLVCCVV